MRRFPQRLDRTINYSGLGLNAIKYFRLSTFGYLIGEENEMEEMARKLGHDQFKN